MLIHSKEIAKINFIAVFPRARVSRVCGRTQPDAHACLLAFPQTKRANENERYEEHTNTRITLLTMMTKTTTTTTMMTMTNVQLASNRTSRYLLSLLENLIANNFFWASDASTKMSDLSNVIYRDIQSRFAVICTR